MTLQRFAEVPHDFRERRNTDGVPKQGEVVAFVDLAADPVSASESRPYALECGANTWQNIVEQVPRVSAIGSASLRRSLRAGEPRWWGADK